MALIYPENEPKVPGQVQFSNPINEWSTDAVMKCWTSHVENRAYLEFMFLKGSPSERRQATSELEIANRKIMFWNRHPNFDREAAGLVLTRVQRDWARR